LPEVRPAVPARLSAPSPWRLPAGSVSEAWTQGLAGWSRPAAAPGQEAGPGLARATRRPAASERAWSWAAAPVWVRQRLAEPGLRPLRVAVPGWGPEPLRL